MKYTVYYVSWCYHGGNYSRCFNTPEERERFKRSFVDGIGNYISTWEKECVCFT